MTTEYEKNTAWQNGGMSTPWFQQFTPQTGHKLTQLTLMLHGSYSPYTITVEETTNGIPNGTVKATFTFSGSWSGWAARTATCTAVKLNQGQVYAIHSAGTGAHGLNNANTYAYGVYKFWTSGAWYSYAGDAYFIEAGDPLPVAPTVTTQSPTDINKTSCTGNGNITSTGGENCTRRGFCYKAGTSGDPTVADSVAYDDGDFGTGAYTKSITGLTPDTSYRVRAYAINSEGTSYGETCQIKTLVSATYLEILTADRALALDNATEFTPSANYHPATKKYVDDSCSFNKSLVPITDDAYWIGEIASPFKAIKGLIIKDTTDGRHYKITVVNGVLTATALD